MKDVQAKYFSCKRLPGRLMFDCAGSDKNTSLGLKLLELP